MESFPKQPPSLPARRPPRISPVTEQDPPTWKQESTAETEADQETLTDAPLEKTKSKGFREVKKPRRRWYPATRIGRILFWSALSILLVIVVAAIVTICVIVTHSNSSSGSGSSGNGSTTTTSLPGHPLAIADGGPDLGQPGDIAKFGNRSTDHFVLISYRSSFVTRLDPIVNPGGLASHLHRVHGSSYFTPNLIKASDIQNLANCSTTVVQDDKSAYWVAALYYKWPNNTMTNIPLKYTSVYYFQKAPTGVPLHPFPDNYNLVAGNPYRRFYNASDTTQNALWYQCYRGGGHDLVSRGFPPSQCVGGLVQVIVFPSCWDGQYADDGNYASHVSYPFDGVNGYYCPAAFPNKFPTLQFETTFDTGHFPNNSWVMANGDTSGLGIHADFMNGWKADTLKAFINDCRYMNATDIATHPQDPANCPALNATINLNITLSCRSQTPIVNETVGEVVPISTLPGCNALWTGNVPKPPCPPGTIEGGTPNLVQPSVWYHNEGYVS